MLEPEYVDDPWEEEKRWLNSRNASKYNILELVFRAVGRPSRRFRSQAEFRKWEKASRLDDEWLKNCTTWAAGKNEGKMKVAIQLPQLLSAMLNKARYDDWRSHQVPGILEEAVPEIIEEDEGRELISDE